MDSIFADYFDFVGIFIDDMVVFSQNLEDHQIHVSKVLERLSDFNFKIKIEKCKIGYSQIELLGHVVGCGKIKPDVRKLNDIWKMPKPNTGKELQSFLGSINYLRGFMPKFSNVARPLNSLRNVKGKLGVKWGPNQQESFETLKEMLKFELNLSVPDFTKTFYVGTDASNHGVGGVLYQKEGKELKIISIVSKSLSKSQRNYPITKKELYAMVYCVSKFHDWILGRHFVLMGE